MITGTVGSFTAGRGIETFGTFGTAFMTLDWTLDTFLLSAFFASLVFASTAPVTCCATLPGNALARPTKASMALVIFLATRCGVA